MERHTLPETSQRRLEQRPRAVALSALWGALESVRWWLLLLIGGASLLPYIWLAFTYPLLPSLVRGRATWATLGERTLTAGGTHGLIYALICLLYSVAIVVSLWKPPHESSRMPLLIWGIWLFATLILLTTYPGESLDIFDYLFRGRMIAAYHASPLAIAPSRYATRPFYELITWRGQVDTYGPLWEYVSGATVWLTARIAPDPIPHPQAALVWYITGYRVVAVVLMGVSGWLIGQIVAKRNHAWTHAALIVWLWNPLLLIASAVGAHNDLLMVPFILSAVWCWQRQRWRWGLVALLLATHVKLTALLLLPVWGIWLVRRLGWRRSLGIGVSVAPWMLGFSWLLYAPFGGWATLPRMLRERTLYLASSPADLLYRWLREERGWFLVDARQWAIAAATLTFCCVASIIIFRLLDLRTFLHPKGTQRMTLSDEDLWRCSAYVTVAYLLIGSFWLMPWYLLWVLPFAALLPEQRLARWWMPWLTLGLLWSGLSADVVTFLRPPIVTPTQVAWMSVGLLTAIAVGVLVVEWIALNYRRSLHGDS